MSKEIWCDAYDEKYDECISEGHSEEFADDAAVEWANGAQERLMDFADNQRKSQRENIV